MQQEIQKWKLLFKTTMESASVKLMPKFRAQIRAITEAMINFRRKVMDNLPKAIEAIMPIIDVIMRIAEAFIKITTRIASGAMTIIGWLLRLNEETGGWAGYILAAAAAWKYLNLAFLASPLGMLLLLAAVVALLIDDFLTFEEGGESLIDWGSDFGIVMQDVTAALIGFLAYLALSKAAVIAMTVASCITIPKSLPQSISDSPPSSNVRKSSISSATTAASNSSIPSGDAKNARLRYFHAAAAARM
jgi:hypothetical protein